MNRSMRALATLFLAICAASTYAQGRSQTFQLGVPITEQFLGCLEKKDAVELIDADAKGEEAFGRVANAKLQGDLCRVVHWTITYHELVHKATGRNGEHLAVYRGTVNGKSIFVPMSGFTHAEIRI